MSVLSSPATWSRKQLRAERVPVSMPAKVVTMSAYQFPELADISQSGAKLRGGTFPPKGSVAILKVGPLEVLCRVVRITGDECGVRFEEAVSPRIIKQIHLGGTVRIDYEQEAPAQD